MFKKLLVSLCLFFSIGYVNAVCPLLDEKGVPRVDLHAQAKLEECIKQEPSTKSLYFDKTTKKYSPERFALHQKIIDDVLKNKPCSSNKPAIAIFTAGLPGAGKTTYLKKYLKNMDNYVIIDADSIREKIPEYKGWNATNTQEEVNEIVMQVLSAIGKPCNVDIIYDSSMSSPQRYIDLTKKLKTFGYKVYIIYVRVPMNVAEERALKRYQTSKRYVSKEFLNYVDKAMEPSFNKVKPVVDGYIVFDGMNGKLVEKGGDLMQAFSFPNDSEGSKK